MKTGFKLFAVMMLSAAAVAATAICGHASGEPTIKVSEVVVENGGSVDVPIELSDNTGICGATLSVTYDSRLTLTNVTKGTALPSLTLTKPGNFSANPITLPWDGLDADSTNGTIAVLTFTVPDSAGEYDVTVSYEDGDIVDGDINPLDVKLQQGGIKVQPQSQSIAAQNIGVFTADNSYEGDSVVATAFKADLAGVNGSISVKITAENGKTQTFTSVTQITDSDVILGVVVSGLADENATGEITIN